MTADQDTAEAYRNQDVSDITTTVAIQADQQPMSTDSASDHYERGVVTDDEMVEFERAKQDTITITLDRADAEMMIDSLETSTLEWNCDDDQRLANIVRAALEGER